MIISPTKLSLVRDCAVNNRPMIMFLAVREHFSLPSRRKVRENTDVLSLCKECGVRVTQLRPLQGVHTYPILSYS